MSGIEILIGDHQGIYIPQQFAGWQGWSNIRKEDIEVLLEGPDHDWYWDAWNDVLNDATYTDANGNVWHLYQDGDLFAFCEELMTDEEYENFFGEARYAA